MRNLPAKTPRVPLKYQEAVRALQAVRTIEDAKFYADKAEALAAWAKIYKDDAAGLEARRVKLHAYRRMGELAEELRPTRESGPGQLGRPPGAVSVLKEHGFSQSVAGRIVQIARAPKARFNRAVARGAGVNTAALAGRGAGLAARHAASSQWQWLTQEIRLRAMLERPVKEVAVGMAQGELHAARMLVQAGRRWLDELDDALAQEQYERRRP